MDKEKKILIINQHSMNHGDEAAGLALVRTLYRAGFKDITVLYNMTSTDEQILLKYEDVNNIQPAFSNKRGISKMIQLYLMYPNWLTRFFLGFFSNRFEIERGYIQQADYIISAPGGVNMGLYRDMMYVWRLREALVCQKKTAMYSPSIGPFQKDDFFSKLATSILKRLDFLSLRDNQSYEYAESLGVDFLRSIDTAFLETPNLILPNGLIETLPVNYVVIVPNELYRWHPRFKKHNKQKFQRLYLGLINKFTSEGVHVVLLPQLFGQGNLADEEYFRTLKGENENVLVVSTKYNSDVQQAIIRKAKFVVGARYHTIVFSINNIVPFFCLSYEHKMKNMLEVLGLDALSVEISIALDTPKEVIGAIWRSYLSSEDYMEEIAEANRIAKDKAFDTFFALKSRLLK